MGSFLRAVSGLVSGPRYSPLDDGTGDAQMRDVGASRLEMERRPMLNGSDGDADDDEDLNYDLETGSRTQRSKALSWRLRRRRPIFVQTLWVTVIAAVIIGGAWWGYGVAFPSVDDISDYTEPNPSEGWLQAEDGTMVLENDSSHVLVPIPSSLPETDGLLPPMDTRPPLDALVHYYQTGDLPSVHFAQPSIDLLYLYVNSSSPYFAAAREERVESTDNTLKKAKNKERHWRDNGELRGAMRSGALSLTGRVSRIHVISAAFDFDNDQQQLPQEDGVVGWRMGQIPSWLDWTNKSNVNWHFHPSIFRLPRDNDGSLAASIKDVNEDEWHKSTLPTFNSFQIESRIPWVKGLSEEYIHSNDDMFLLREMSHGDFFHPIYGSVLRLDPGLDVKPKVRDNQRTDSGEWGGLNYASSILSQRFPRRDRIYMHHMPKAQKRSLIHEASIMFAPQLTEAATRPFRESNIGVADVEIAWLTTHLQIERWREALLYVWAVTKIGDLEGNWGLEARDELRRVLKISKGSEKGAKATFDTTKKDRNTIENFDGVSAQGAWEMPQASKILYTSLDGHMALAPYSEEEYARKAELERKPRKGQKVRPIPPTTCTFDVDECLPLGFWDDFSMSSVVMFKHFAFEKPQCGDCLIEGLVMASGDKGLTAFLPPADKVYTPPAREPQQWDREEPMLPLTTTWEEADFSMANNIRLGQDKWTRMEPKQTKDGEVNLLDWSVKLLSRYAYVYATSPINFQMIHGTVQMHNVLKQLTNDHNLAMACINDDQPDKGHPHVRAQFQRWMREQFGEESKFVQWEKYNVSWDESD